MEIKVEKSLKEGFLLNSRKILAVGKRPLTIRKMQLLRKLMSIKPWKRARLQIFHFLRLFFMIPTLLQIYYTNTVLFPNVP